MNPIKRNLFLILVTMLFFCPLIVSGQESPPPPEIKSVIVYEEKFDKLISRRLKESETTYDIHGNILEDIQYKDGKVDKHFKYQYDANNNKIKETEYDPSGEIIEYSEYKFNRNLRVEKIVYDPKGKIKSKKEYIYTTF